MIRLRAGVYAAAVDAAKLLADVDARLEPLEATNNLAWWDAAVHVSEDNDARREAADLALRSALADPDTFAQVVAAIGGGERSNGLHRRALEVLHLEMAPNQVPADVRARLVELETRVDSAFSSHRGTIGGQAVDDNEILEVLTSSDDVALRQDAWEASKSVGAVVAPMVRELVAVRNELAARLGHPDFYAAALVWNELDEQRLFATLDDVEAVTDLPFRAWKRDLDAQLAARFGCPIGGLRPWHYDDPFFQDVPVTGRPSLDPFVADADLEAVTVATFAGCGLDISPALGRSDLSPRDAKNQHAFCLSVDRADDVRVLGNVVPTERWAETMLHEFGHAIYDLEIDRALPFRLRAPAHMLTTEAVAMLFGRIARDPEWLRSVVGADADAVDALAGDLAALQRAQLLVFARWALVMCHFERGLYQSPDADHDTRWWDLVERFQLVHRPDGRVAPDWAAKIHLASAPVYYQNYLYGELLASQLMAGLAADCGGVVGRPGAGAWLTERVFRPGASMRWDHLVAAATGSLLGTAAWAAELA